MLRRMTVTTCRPSAEHPGGSSKALPEEAVVNIDLKKHHGSRYCCKTVWIFYHISRKHCGSQWYRASNVFWIPCYVSDKRALHLCVCRIWTSTTVLMQIPQICTVACMWLKSVKSTPSLVPTWSVEQLAGPSTWELSSYTGQKSGSVGKKGIKISGNMEYIVGPSCT